MSYKSLGITLVIALLGVWVIWLGQNDAEKQIHARMDGLIELAAKSGNESKLQSLSKAKQMSEYFAEDARVQILNNMTASMDRKTLMGYFIQARGSASTLSVDMQRRSLTVDADGVRAEMVFTGDAEVDFGGQVERHKQRYQMSLVQEDGDWLIAEIRIAE